jgi:hypothetical protein
MLGIEDKWVALICFFSNKKKEEQRRKSLNDSLNYKTLKIT